MRQQPGANSLFLLSFFFSFFLPLSSHFPISSFLLLYFCLFSYFYVFVCSDASQGGSILSAAELSSSKEYIQTDDGSWTISYSVRIYLFFSFLHLFIHYSNLFFLFTSCSIIIFSIVYSFQLAMKAFTLQLDLSRFIKRAIGRMSTAMKTSQ